MAMFCPDQTRLYKTDVFKHRGVGVRALAVSAAVWLALSGNAWAQTAVANNQLPTGGQVNAGQA
ncbi:MAG: hypothetical protein ACOVOX_10150, partial [Burkholderiaceae bacterium]